MDKFNHKLFQEYPITGHKKISAGRVPVPYHVYDGHGMFIGGTADLTNIRELLKNETVQPMQTAAGQAIMGIWIVDFSAASLDAHHELQFSFLVSHQETAPIASHPLALLKALFTDPAARMFCYKIWNNMEVPVAYNRELLGLPAELCFDDIWRENGRKIFSFVDEEGQVLLQGHAQENKRTAPAVGWSLLRLMGLRQSLRASREAYLGAKVVNPSGEVIPTNADAQSFVAADTAVVQFFDPVTDQVRFNETDAELFNFQPQFIEHFAPFRFVYLMPEIDSSK